MIMVGVPVREQTDEMIIEGYNSLLRAYLMLLKPYSKEIPGQFTLGKNHLKFFMDKGQYIINHLNSVRTELVCRGLQNDERVKDGLPYDYHHVEKIKGARHEGWYETPTAYHKVRRRLFKKYGVRVHHSYLHKKKD